MNRYWLLWVLGCCLAFVAGSSLLTPSAATGQADEVDVGMARFLKAKLEELDQPGLEDRVKVRFSAHLTKEATGPVVLQPDAEGDFEVKTIGPDWLHIERLDNRETYYIIPFSQLIVHRESN